MSEKVRGAWVPEESSAETMLRRAFAKQRLEREGTVTKDMLSFRLRRKVNTAQPRKSFAGEVLSNCSKRQRIR